MPKARVVQRARTRLEPQHHLARSSANKKGHVMRLVFISAFTVIATLCHAQEIYIEKVLLPGAGLDQEVTYYPTKADYEAARADILERLNKGDQTAMVNPTEGPWRRVETTATIGFSYKGVGTSSGRKYLRQMTAAEEALYLFESGT